MSAILVAANPHSLRSGHSQWRWETLRAEKTYVAVTNAAPKPNFGLLVEAVAASDEVWIGGQNRKEVSNPCH